MLLERFYDDKLAQASYLVGCPESGEALIIDPARDIVPYLRAAERHDFKIIGCAETHIHADFVSGSRELAHETGATMFVSGHGKGDLKYKFPDGENLRYMCQEDYLCQGDHIMVGGVRLDVIYSPGHTPEHIMFLLTDSNTDKPYALFSGDCLFVGDMGRPDLLETFISAENDRVTGAKQQYANMLRLKQMPDYIQVFPGHGAGSACGKALGAVPSSSLGYEKLVNPAFQQPDEESFVDWLLAGQPEAPAYFARMKIVNQVGPSLMADLDLPQKLDIRTLDSLLNDPNVMVIDARAPEDFAAGHIAGTFHMPGTSDLFSTYVGWYVNYDQPVYLIAEADDILRLIHELRAIGVDNLLGYFVASELGAMTATLKQVDAQAALHSQKDGTTILDVRNQTERDEEYIPGSQFIPLGYIMRHLDEIPRDRRVIVHCGGGVRSQVVASVLRRQGFTNIENLEGGIDAWKRANLPLKTDG